MAGPLPVFYELENAILCERVRAGGESGQKGSTVPPIHPIDGRWVEDWLRTLIAT
jgi:hypothetical protein